MARLTIARRTIEWALLGATIGSISCVSLRPVIVDKKTRFESDVLGDFERVHEELLALPTAPPSEISAAQRRAIQNVVDRQLNRRLLRPLKREHVVGEGRDGMLAIIREPSAPEQVERVRERVMQENRARETLISAVIELNPGLGGDARRDLRSALYRRNVMEAEPGDAIQDQRGQWRLATRDGALGAPIEEDGATLEGS